MGILGMALPTLAVSISLLALLLTGGCTHSSGTFGSTYNSSVSTNGDKNVSGAASGARSVRSLLGCSVQNQDGQTLGHLSDVIFDLNSGYAEYVLLTSGGFLGLGSKTIVAPARALRANTAKKNVLAIGLSRQQWTRAPRFGSDLHLAQPLTRQEIDEFYRSENVPGQASPNSSPPRFERATELLGKTVLTRQATPLGTLHDLLAHLEEPKPAVAVLSLASSREVLVELDALRANRNQQLVLKVQASRVEPTKPATEPDWRAALELKRPNARRAQRRHRPQSRHRVFTNLEA